MQNNFIETSEFIKHLDNWLLKSEQRDAQYLNLNSNKIPSIFKKRFSLYRSVSLKIEDVNTLLKNKKLKIEKVTSWSKDKNIALRFTQDKNMKLRNFNEKRIDLLYNKMFSSNDIIIDIDSFVNFYGETKLLEMGIDDLNIDSAMKEKEVLIKPFYLDIEDIEFV